MAGYKLILLFYPLQTDAIFELPNGTSTVQYLHNQFIKMDTFFNLIDVFSPMDKLAFFDLSFLYLFFFSTKLANTNHDENTGKKNSQIAKTIHSAGLGLESE